MTSTQHSPKDLATPLIDVTFCVLDLETTGGSAVDDAVCEIGVVKVRGGECIGTFHTLVDPGRAVPPGITVLTGLTTAMVVPAPRIGSVLPSLLEFLGDAVLVAHNARFDAGFLDAALCRDDRPPLPNRVVDTVSLARRLVGEEVPNCKLATLADRFRLDHRPTHRALDDALATTDLLHLLFERASGYGVHALDDLVALPSTGSHPQAAKLGLTSNLPRGPGVYLFRDVAGRVIFVGKGANLRHRVRSYFSSDTRPKVHALLREVAEIDHFETATVIEAAVLEIRLIHHHLPRYNRQGATGRRAAYVKLTAERFPRLSVVKSARDDGAVYLGPLSSHRSASLVIDAVQAALPIRRCTADPAKSPPQAPCAPAQIGDAACPCSGAISETEYQPIADEVARALTTRPDLVIGPLQVRIDHLAVQGRHEEAADLRDQTNAFVDAHRRVRGLEQIHRARRLVVRLGDHRFVFQHGHFSMSESIVSPTTPHHRGAASVDGPALVPPLRCESTETPSLVLGGVAPADADELGVVSAWLDKHAGRLHLEECEGQLCSPLPRLPDVGHRDRSVRARALR